MQTLTRTHYIAWILGSFLFGLLCIFPAIMMRLDSTVDFQGIEMQASDAEYHYAARVKEIQDGFPLASNVYYAGNKQQPYLQPPLPEWIVAQLGGLFQLDAARSLLLSQWLFGIGVFATMVGCFFALTGRFWESFIGVTIMLEAGFIFSGPGIVASLLWGGMGQVDALTFARPINPQWSALLFFGALWVLYLWLERHSRRLLILLGVLTVMAFYSYVYTWTLLGAMYAIIGIRFFVRRDGQRVKELTYLAIGLLIGVLPYLWNVWEAGQTPFYHETAMRLGLVAERHPAGGLFFIASFGIAFLERKIFSGRVKFAWVFAIAAFLVLNQQIITGQSVVSSHYHWYFIKPFVVIFAIIMMAVWIHRWINKKLTHHPRYLSLVYVLTIASICFSLGLGGLYQWRFYQQGKIFWAQQQASAGTLRYIRDHLGPGEVVYAQGFIRNLIPVYTSADVYWAENAYAYLSSDIRARDAYFFDLWIAGVSAEEVEQTFSSIKRAELSSRIHAIYTREAFGSYAAIPDTEVQTSIAAYANMLAQTDEAKLAAYPLDYVVISTKDALTPALIMLREKGQTVYKDEAFEVIKLK